MQKFRKRAVARATIPAAAAASFVNPTKLRNVKKDGKRSSEKVLEKTKIYFPPPPTKKGNTHCYFMYSTGIRRSNCIFCRVLQKWKKIE